MIPHLPLLAALLCTLVHIWMVQAQYTPAEKEKFVKVHNKLRSSANPKPNKPLNMLKWDDELEWLTKESLKNRGCDGKHTDRSILGFKGENIHSVWWAPIDREEPKANTAPTASVKGWYDEKKWFNHKEYKCYPPKGKTCGHYYQVMWSETTAIGCARCKKTELMEGTNYNVVHMVCQYNRGVISNQQFYEYDKSTSCGICPLTDVGSSSSGETSDSSSPGGTNGLNSPGGTNGLNSPEGTNGLNSPEGTNGLNSPGGTTNRTVSGMAARISSGFFLPAVAAVALWMPMCHMML